MVKKAIAWIFTALVFTAVGGVGVWTYVQTHGLPAKHEGEAAEEKGESDKEEAADSQKKGEEGKEGHATSAPFGVKRSATGEVVVNFNRETQERMGLTAVELKPQDRRPELVAYGVLTDEPNQSFTLRAPMPGFLQVQPNVTWPRVGDQVASGKVVGRIEPRLGPVERADLASRLATARAEVEENRASLDAARLSYESKKELAKNQMVSQRVLEEAQAKYKSEEAKLRAAEQNVKVFESSLTATSGPTGPLPLKVDRAGQVVQVLAQPGEEVESGQTILQVSNFEHLLARVDLLIGQTGLASVDAASIVVAGHEQNPLKGERVGLAAAADPRSGGHSLLFRVSSKDLVLQPGMSITAYLPLSAKPQKGFEVPRSAIVRVAGKAWVYVQEGEDKFTRREVPLDWATPLGWYVTKGLQPGARIVTQGAQSLLSEEFSFTGGEEE